MKYGWITTLVILLSVSSAMADNTVVQTNDFSAIGTGSGTIVQTGSNWASVSGDGNYVSQLNDKDAYLYGSGSIAQAVTNGAQVGGTANSVFQSNIGSATIEATATNAMITQTDLNLAFVGQNQPSKNNVVRQDNVETATIRYADGSAIAQTITNLGFVDGTENNLDQGNNVIALDEGTNVPSINTLNNIIQTQNNFADMDGGIGADPDGAFSNVMQDNFADTYIFDSDSSTVDQNQANTAMQSGDLNTADQDNIADADIDPSTGALIDQDQTNLGTQSGTSNLLDQGNNAYADFTSSTTSTIDQDQANTGIQSGTSNQMYQDNNAVAAATDALNSLIDQDQSNFGNQNGVGNVLDQGSNAATANEIYDISTTIAQTQNNFADQIDDSNYGVQDNLANGYAYYGGWAGTALIDQDQSNALLQHGYQPYYGTYASNDAYQYNYANANANSAGEQSSINQLQSNFGDQYGSDNLLDQDNLADGYMSPGVDADNSGIGNTINQEQSNAAVMSDRGATNNVDQDNNADADMYGGWDGTSNQYQSNFADTFDFWDNVADQSNVGVSLVRGDGADVVTQTQANIAYINAYTWNGKAYQDNYANANTDSAYYDDDDLITQTESNIAFITGYWSPVEMADQDNILNAAQGYLSSVDITQTASNLATINGP